MTIDEEARALYERNAPVAPRWEDLNDVTREVWREDVLKRRGAESPRSRVRLEPERPRTRNRLDDAPRQRVLL